MKCSRRGFLKLSGATGLGLVFGELGFNLEPVAAKVMDFKIKSARIVPTICPYCSCGCGILCYVENGKIINTEGDPDHPINRGSLCSKGSSLYQIANNERRLGKPLYRAPGSSKWETREWDWVMDRIAEKVKQTRDNTFISSQKVKDSKTGGDLEVTVNRTEGIACMGGAALDNEECYLLTKAMRSMGLVYLEHQARI